MLRESVKTDQIEAQMRATLENPHLTVKEKLEMGHQLAIGLSCAQTDEIAKLRKVNAELLAVLREARDYVKAMAEVHGVEEAAGTLERIDAATA